MGSDGFGAAATASIEVEVDAVVDGQHRCRFGVRSSGHWLIMAKHLHPEAGGNPSQSAKGEMANPTPDPGTGNDFPDAPDEASAAAESADEQPAD